MVESTNTLPLPGNVQVRLTRLKMSYQPTFQTSMLASAQGQLRAQRSFQADRSPCSEQARIPQVPQKIHCL